MVGHAPSYGPPVHMGQHMASCIHAGNLVAPLHVMHSPCIGDAENQRACNGQPQDVLERASPGEVVIAGCLVDDEALGGAQEIEEEHRHELNGGQHPGSLCRWEEEEMEKGWMSTITRRDMQGRGG